MSQHESRGKDDKGKGVQKKKALSILVPRSSDLVPESEVFMRHTFLFEEGIWRAEGTYIDGSNTSLRAEGTITITHTPERWINEGSLKLLLASPVEFQNRYEIVPFEEGCDFTTWNSFNPVIGELKGRIVIVDDSFISVYKSEDGQYSGSEYLLQVSATVYANRGFAFKDNEKISSWAVQLSKVK